MPLTLAAGLLAGGIIAALTVFLEHSRIAFGAYALYGNGSLIVPSLVAPFALYPGWTWALRRGGRALELSINVAGLHFGVGLISAFDVIFFPQDPDLTLLDALPGFLLSGAIFVLPAALLAALAPSPRPPSGSSTGWAWGSSPVARSRSRSGDPNAPFS